MPKQKRTKQKPDKNKTKATTKQTKQTTKPQQQTKKKTKRQRGIFDPAGTVGRMMSYASSDGKNKALLRKNM
jgi:hypothetical protein